MASGYDISGSISASLPSTSATGATQFGSPIITHGLKTSAVIIAIAAALIGGGLLWYFTRAKGSK